MQRDVLDELRWEPSVDAAHIGVSVKEGIVTLTGQVSSYAESYAAERVYGVKAVANERDVKLPGSSRRTDEDIAASAVGTVRSWVEKEEAAREARAAPGVTSVENLIVVAP